MAGDRLYDPADPGFGGRAFEVYRVLRDHHPVYFCAGRNCHLLSRYEDVRAAASDPATFSSERTSISQGLLPMIQQMDPPEHDVLRRMGRRPFSPRRVAALEGRIRAVAAGLLDPLRSGQEVDLLRVLAAELPSRIMAELIGIPEERRPTFLEWTEAMVGADPHGEVDTTPFAGIYGEFAKLLAERRARRAADTMSELLEAEEDGWRLRDEELLGFCFQLVVAGNDTTMNLIGNGAVLLARDRELRHELARRPSLIPAAVEEILRLESPVQALPRRLTRAVSLHGVEVPAGSEVMLLFGSANRDDRVFPDPDRFDLGRRGARHLAFGHGTHYCLGAHLARLEARVAFEELLARFPDFALLGEPELVPSAWARARVAVPVALGRDGGA